MSPFCMHDTRLVDLVNTPSLADAQHQRIGKITRSSTRSGQGMDNMAEDNTRQNCLEAPAREGAAHTS